MKLNFFSLENGIDFSKNNVWRMFIYNQGMFVNTINNLNNLCGGVESDEKISLYKDDNIIRWDKEVAFIVNPWSIEEYEKSLQTSLHKYIEREVIQLDRLSDFQEKINEINNILSDTISEINLDIIYKNIMVADYLKAIGLKANMCVGNAYDNIINFVNAMSYVNNYILIILVNSNIYFNKNELIEIFKQVRYNEVNILTIDMCGFEEKLEDESIILIDEDFCEKLY